MELSSTAIEQKLLKYRAYGIDTMVFIYHFEDNALYTPFTRSLFELIEKGRTRGVTSTLTLMEILVKPKQLGDTAAVEDYKYALLNFPNLTLRSLDAEVAEKAAEIRARYNVRPPDAIQIATSIVEKTDAFITNDLKLKTIKETQIIVINEITKENKL